MTSLNIDGYSNFVGVSCCGVVIEEDVADGRNAKWRLVVSREHLSDLVVQLMRGMDEYDAEHGIEARDA